MFLELLAYGILMGFLYLIKFFCLAFKYLLIAIIYPFKLLADKISNKNKKSQNTIPTQKKKNTYQPKQKTKDDLITIDEMIEIDEIFDDD